MNKLVEINNLTVHYGKICALQEASLTLHEGDFVGIIGPNGGGKSTLVKALLGLIKPTQGTIRFFQNREEVPSLSIGYLPQHSEIDRQFPISVKEVIHSGLSGETAPWVRVKNEHLERVQQMIDQMGLKGLEKRAISELSGGQLQRVLLGRALISEPQLLILDEPTSYLDQGFEDQLYELLVETNLKTTIMLVSHNIASVQAIAKSLACVNRKLHYHPSTNISRECIYESFLR
jgi:zinc transport system ATP-binding protein